MQEMLDAYRDCETYTMTVTEAWDMFVRAKPEPQAIQWSIQQDPNVWMADYAKTVDG